MAKYRKKPVVIEAILWDGNNERQLFDWMLKTSNKCAYMFEHDNLIIETLEGNMIANIGDFIIRGVNGEFYPCKPDIFEKTYELVEE